MTKEAETITVDISSIDDFLNDRKYKKYNNFGEHSWVVNLFEEIATVSNVFKMITFSEVQLPAITGVAGTCYEILKGEYGGVASDKLSPEDRKELNFAKQFIGSVVCYLMENNGYEKTENRKAVSYSNETTGESGTSDPIRFVKGTVYKKKQ